MRDTCPPWGSKFFQFHAVFGKIWQNCMLGPPGELAPPPPGNPGSGTDYCYPLTEAESVTKDCASRRSRLQSGQASMKNVYEC